MSLISGEPHPLNCTSNNSASLKTHGTDFIFWRSACLMPTEHPGSKRFFFGLADDSLSDAELPSTKEDIIRMFERLSGRDDLKLGELVWSGTWRPNIRMVETFKQGRVFLSGGNAYSLWTSGEISA